MKRVLVVEDDLFCAEIYREKLNSEGDAVDVATDGASGLETLRSREPDLVLLDLMLPKSTEWKSSRRFAANLIFGLCLFS